MKTALTFDPARTLEQRARDCRSQTLRLLAAALTARIRRAFAGSPRAPAARTAAC